MKTSVLAAIMTAVLAGEALASHTEPAKAKKARFELVNAYFPCVDPNENTATSNGTPANLGVC